MKFKDYPFLNFPDAIANVEVEKDETVMLPNGTVYNIKGKKHKDGGEKVFLPDGTKVFSEHLKLPEDIATKLVGRKTKKSSPAQLSKKFNTLKYKEMMEDNTGKWDRLAVQTAEMMFNKNIAHQNAIFETQEDSKNKKQTDIFKYGGVYKSKTKYQNGGQYPYKLNPSVNEEDNLVTFDFGNQNTGLQPRSENPDLFGKQSQYNPAHVVWQKYYYGEDTNAINFQQRHGEAYKHFTGQDYRYDNKTRTDGKYGNVTAHAPLFSTTMQGTKEGKVTLQQYLDNPSIGDSYGVDLSKAFDKKSKDPFYEVNIFAEPKATIEPFDFNVTSLQGKPIKPLATPELNLPDLLPNPPASNVPERKGPTQEDMLYGVQQGMLLTGLASLGKENPYFNRTELKPIYKRFDPINNLAQERAFNLMRENIESSNLPEQVKQAQLQNMGAKLMESTGQVDLQNYQGKLQLDNDNRQILQNTLNQNVQNRELGNRQYAMDKARVDELYNRQKMGYINNMLDLWRGRVEEQSNVNLLNQMSRNYNIVNGKGTFDAGKGTNIDPNTIRNSYQ